MKAARSTDKTDNIEKRRKTARTVSVAKASRAKTSRKTTAKVTNSVKTAPSAKTTQPASSSKFAEGLCFQKLFFIFLIASVLGSLYEDVLYYVLTYSSMGVGVWMTHRGVIYGPFNVIYGFGAALMCWILLRRKYNDAQIFGLAALVGGLVEYALSFLQEVFTGTTSWDYSHMFLNINGRTSIPIMLMWGILGIVLVKIVYPSISKLIEMIPLKMGEILFVTLVIFMCFNMLISWSAVVRRGLRHKEIPALTPVGEVLDRFYPDAYLERFYPNMEWVDKR